MLLHSTLLTQLAPDEIKDQLQRISEIANETPPAQTCRVCGCTDWNACNAGGEPCHWVEPDLCSVCSGAG